MTYHRDHYNKSNQTLEFLGFFAMVPERFYENYVCGRLEHSFESFNGYNRETNYAPILSLRHNPTIIYWLGM
jgi:hypothetical protein